MSTAVPIALVEGFDHLAAAQLPQKGWAITLANNNAASVSKIPGRVDGEAMSLTCASNETAVATRLFDPTDAFAVGVAMRRNGANAYEPILVRTAAGTNAVRIAVDADGRLSVLNAAGTALIEIDAGRPAMVLDVWHYIELIGTIHSSTATVTLRLDGVDYATAENVNTGSTDVAMLTLRSYACTSFVRRTDFDDLYVASVDTPLGDCIVRTRLPDADGNDEDWTPDDGDDGAARVDDPTSHDGDTSYVASATVGDQSTYAYLPITDEDVEVHAVAVSIAARKTDGGTRTLAPLVRHDGTTVTGPTGPGLSTDYLVQQTVYDVNPETTEDWTLGTVSASEFGVEVIE
jgi:hypothetical protein